MPGKSRRRKGKHTVQATKRNRSVSQRPSVRKSQDTQVEQDVSPSTPPAQPAKVSEPVAGRYPYINKELRDIVILSGVMLVALVVLALVLS